MYAVIATGGKQYRVSVGDILEIEKLENAGDKSVVFEKVLLVADGDNVKFGDPHVTGAQVVADIVSQKRGEKIEIIKFRRRKHHIKRQGHRQYLTEVKIKEIKGL
jgi:large subunit ribosomal protein L21